jgi:ribosome-binding protein aMBF1 (putative translation factor)
MTNQIALQIKWLGAGAFWRAEMTDMDTPRWLASKATGRVDQNVGAAVEAHRSRAGMALHDLAERLGLEVEHLRGIEAGAIRPSASVLAEIARIIGVPLMSFFEDHSRH